MRVPLRPARVAGASRGARGARVHVHRDRPRQRRPREDGAVDPRRQADLSLPDRRASPDGGALRRRERAHGRVDRRDRADREAGGDGGDERRLPPAPRPDDQADERGRPGRAGARARGLSERAARLGGPRSREPLPCPRSRLGSASPCPAKRTRARRPASDLASISAREGTGRRPRHSLRTPAGSTPKAGATGGRPGSWKSRARRAARSSGPPWMPSAIGHTIRPRGFPGEDGGFASRA